MGSVMGQLLLPFCRWVIFVDWHGVLSRDPFWTSILNNDRHRLRATQQVQLGLDLLPARRP